MRFIVATWVNAAFRRNILRAQAHNHLLSYYMLLDAADRTYIERYVSAEPDASMPGRESTKRHAEKFERWDSPIYRRARARGVIERARQTE